MLLSKRNDPKSVMIAVFFVVFITLSFLVLRWHTLEIRDERIQIEAVAAKYSSDIQATLDRALSSAYVLQVLVNQSTSKRIDDFENVSKTIMRSYPAVIELAVAPKGLFSRSPLWLETNVLWDSIYLKHPIKDKRRCGPKRAVS